MPSLLQTMPMHPVPPTPPTPRPTAGGCEHCAYLGCRVEGGAAPPQPREQAEQGGVVGHQRLPALQARLPPLHLKGRKAKTRAHSQWMQRCASAADKRPSLHPIASPFPIHQQFSPPQLFIPPSRHHHHSCISIHPPSLPHPIATLPHFDPPRIPHALTSNSPPPQCSQYVINFSPHTHTHTRFGVTALLSVLVYFT